MKKIVTFLVACLMLLSACGAEPVEITTVANYQEYQAELLEAEFFTANDGKNMVRVSVRFTNGENEGRYLLESFAVNAFQADKELDNYTDINEDDTIIRTITKGQSITSAYVFEVNDDSPITVQLCTPTADEVLLAEREYSK